MTDQPAQTLLEAAKKHWRSFLPAWIFPIIFFYGGKIADREDHPGLFFFLVAIPIFFWSYRRSSSVWTKREVSYKHTVILGLVTPFLVWVAIVFLGSAITGLLGA